MHKPFEIHFSELENLLRWQENMIRWELALAQNKETQKHRLAANFDRERAASHRDCELLEWEANRTQRMQLESFQDHQLQESRAQGEWRIQNYHENKSLLIIGIQNS